MRQKRGHDRVQCTCLPDQCSSGQHHLAPVWLQDMHHVQAGLLAFVVNLQQATHVIQQSIAMHAVKAWFAACLRDSLPRVPGRETGEMDKRVRTMTI